jgi:hypothetical protein
MLDQSLLDLAAATCFSGPGLSNKLKTYLLAPACPSTFDRAAFMQDCHKLLRADLDADYPRRFRLNDIEQAMQVLWSKNMFFGEAGGKLPFLDRIFTRLLIAHGDHVQYRDGRVQEYARFAARMDPALLVSWRFAQRIGERPYLQTRDLIRMITAQQTFFAPLPITGQAVADNHVHVGGVHYAGMALMAGLLPLDASPLNRDALKSNHETPKAFAELQRLAQGLLGQGSLLPDDVSHAENTSHEERAAVALRIKDVIKQSMGMQSIIDAPDTLSWGWLAQQPESARADNPRWLRQQIAIAITKQDIGQAWLWFLLWMWTYYQHPDCDARLRMAIFYLLSGLMRVRRDLIMDGQGLGRFVEYYGRPRRDAPDHCAAVSAANALFQSAEDVAELKIAPNRMQPKKIGKWLQNLARATGVPVYDGTRPLPSEDVSLYRQMMDRWHYCVHFSRSKEFQHLPEKIWRQAKMLQKQIESEAGLQSPGLSNDHDDDYEADIDDSNRNRRRTDDRLRLIPARWLRGLDVAGDENLTKTEIYAPALRWLREGMRSKHGIDPASAGLHFSIHVGEDYAHPWSGMRHIDEAVNFCQMRAGDRLGHALAIGISARDWIAAHGEILLPVEEHLDNLVWAWHYATLMSSRLPLAAQVLPLLARRIQKMLRHVPWAHGGCMEMDAGTGRAGAKQRVNHCTPSCPSAARLQAITPEHLFDAWQLRRNCSYQLSQYENSGGIRDRQTKVGLPDLKVLTTHCRPCGTEQVAASELDYAPDVMLYRQRWRWLAQRTGIKKPPEKGCDSIAPVRIVRIGLEVNVHDAFAAGTDDEAESALIFDSHSPQELDFIDALQDWLLDAYDQKGLVIEANPTSKVYIARLNNHAEHPIFRWYPPNEDWLKPGERFNRFGLRRGPIKVCINTDDPGIMPTTLRTEYALLREAALEHGVTRTDADSWLARLRAFGLEEFRQKHLPVWVAMPRSAG